MVVALVYEWMKMKYLWMNEADSVVAKGGSLIEVPYVDPSFLGSLDVKSMIRRSHGIWTNDMKNVMCYMQYVMCYAQNVMCCVPYDKYDDSCYSHWMTFLIQILNVYSLSKSKFWKIAKFPIHNLASPWLDFQ